jgi:hypothetical protein
MQWVQLIELGTYDTGCGTVDVTAADAWGWALAERWPMAVGVAPWSTPKERSTERVVELRLYNGWVEALVSDVVSGKDLIPVLHQDSDGEPWTLHGMYWGQHRLRPMEEVS